MRIAGALLVAMMAACARNPTPRCAASSDCARNEACYRGVCLPEREVDGGPPPPCAIGSLRCDDDCIDPLTDRDHCGACDHECRGREDRCALGICVH